MMPIKGNELSSDPQQSLLFDLQQQPQNSANLKKELSILTENLENLENLEKIRDALKINKNRKREKWSEIRSEISCLKDRIEIVKQDIEIYSDIEENGCFGGSLLGRCISGICQVISVPVTIGANFAVNHPILATGILFFAQIKSVFSELTDNQEAPPSNRTAALANINAQDCNEFSFMAMVRQRNSQLPNGICSATVVAKNKVLTAQHCTTQFGWGHPSPLQPSQLLVHQGCETSVQALKNPNCTYNVVNIENFSGYLQGSLLNDQNDIALLTVDRNFECAEQKKVISQGNHEAFKKESHQLNHQLNHHPERQPRHNVRANGWGLTHKNRNTLSNKVKSVPLTTYHNASEPHCDEMICTQNFDKSKILDTCQGDSGGPLFWKRTEASDAELVGLISSGGADCDGGNSLNVDLYKKKDWILDHTQNSVDSCMEIKITKNYAVKSDGTSLSHMKIINQCAYPVETKFKSDCYHTKERTITTAPKGCGKVKYKHSVTVADCSKGPEIKNKQKLNFSRS